MSLDPSNFVRSECERFVAFEYKRKAHCLIPNARERDVTDIVHCIANLSKIWRRSCTLHNYSERGELGAGLVTFH